MRRQGIFLIPTILILPNLFGLDGILLSQPLADLLTVLVTVLFSIRMKREMKRWSEEIYVVK